MTKASSWSEDDATARGPGKALVALGGIFLLAAVGLSAAFRAAEWRAENVLMPRYCEQREAHLVLLRRVLTDRAPVGQAGRRAYMIAAKLLFVVPRRKSEPLDVYIDRLRARVAESCR